MREKNAPQGETPPPKSAEDSKESKGKKSPPKSPGSILYVTNAAYVGGPQVGEEGFANFAHPDISIEIDF
jgi:hypothetical protein